MAKFTHEFLPMHEQWAHSNYIHNNLPSNASALVFLMIKEEKKCTVNWELRADADAEAKNNPKWGFIRNKYGNMDGV